MVLLGVLFTRIIIHHRGLALFVQGDREAGATADGG
jgi:hypothetical protein